MKVKSNYKKVALALECNSNLIFLGKLRETGINFYNNLIIIMLIRNRKVIAHTRRYQNLFILKLAQPRKVMATINIKGISTQTKAMATHGQGPLIYLISNKKLI